MLPPAFVLTLHRSSERFKRCQEHFTQAGITATPFYGLDHEITGLRTEHKYEIDNAGYIMGPKQISLHLSHYMLWKMLLYQPEDSFLVLEDDCRWKDDWKQSFLDAQSVLPADWDIVYLGSCCTSDKPQWNVGKNLYVVNFPMCTHGYMVRKKALPILLEHCQRVYAPVDICMVFNALHRLKHFTIVPRICDQYETVLFP